MAQPDYTTYSEEELRAAYPKVNRSFWTLVGIAAFVVIGMIVFGIVLKEPGERSPAVMSSVVLVILIIPYSKNRKALLAEMERRNMT